MKVRIILFALLGLLLIGCANNSYLPLYNTPAWDQLYQGGDGSSTLTAIIINTSDYKKTVEFENHYLTNTLSAADNTYRILSESDYTEAGRVYHLINVVLKDGLLREYHFDVSIPYRSTLEK